MAMRRMFVAASIFFGFFAATPVFAGTIGFSPSGGTFPPGKTFSVSILATSRDQSANAFSGRISFPSDKLQVTSLNKSGSIISVWVQEPSFSNQAGTINFEGIVLNPGFTGSGGRLITISFKTIAEGTAAIQFTDGSMLANDGEGTDILSGLGSAVFTIGSGGVQEDKVEPKENVPAAPIISSPTHPEPSRWYKERAARFTWTNPSGITGVSFVLNRESGTTPSTQSDGFLSAYVAEQLDEGSWYFHLRLRNKSGWGPPSHERIRIDTTAPTEPVITLLPTSGEELMPRVIVAASDTLSGVERYELQIDKQESLVVVPDAMDLDKPYTLPVQDTDAHTLVVRAYDFAGNVSEARAEFQAGSLEPPRFTIPSRISEGDVLRIQGSTYPNSHVDLFLEDSHLGVVGPYKSDSDEQGFFTFVWPTTLGHGAYRLWSTVTDGNGVKSPESPRLSLTVRPDWWALFTRVFSMVFSPLVFFIALMIALVVFLAHHWHPLLVLRGRKHTDQIHGVEHETYKAFNRLRDDMRVRILLLRKSRSARDLAAKKKELMKQWKKDVNAFEKAVGKRLDDIDKSAK